VHRRMLGFLEQQELPSDTLVTARRYTRDARGALIHEKRCFFLFSWSRNRPALALYHQAQGS